MTQPTRPGDPVRDDNARTQTEGTAADRKRTRRRVAARLQWACSHMPMTIAADDEKALVLAELIIREVLGEPPTPSVHAAAAAAEGVR